MRNEMKRLSAHDLVYALIESIDIEARVPHEDFDRYHNHFIDLREETISRIASLESQLADAQARLAGYEWIPVSERLPEDRATILAAFKNREILTATYYKRYEGFGGVENYWPIEGWYSGEVTHWMPLPEAPKEDE